MIATPEEAQEKWECRAGGRNVAGVFSKCCAERCGHWRDCPATVVEQFDSGPAEFDTGHAGKGYCGLAGKP